MSMMPEEGDTTIQLPVTFDYSGGRGDNKKANIVTALVITVLTIVVIVGLVRNEDLGVGSKCIYIGAVVLVSSLFVRFKILREVIYSDAYESLKAIDYAPGTDSFWSIFEIDGEYPYICHYKDGKNGIFIKLEKDVIVGKPDDISFIHYDAISEAYNLASQLNMSMAHIDYMDNVGNDPRLRGLYEGLNDCDNPDLRDVLLDVYTNLQDQMSQDYASFDVYVFTSRGDTRKLWDNVKMCVDKLLCGNYLSYRALDIEGVRTTCMAVFNLNDFSAIEACNSTVKGNRFRGIVPIRVEHIDGVDELNKTQAQLREEAKAREEAELEAKRNKRYRPKRSVKPDTSNEEVVSSDTSNVSSSDDK